MIKAVIFDMDGVLISSESYHPKVIREVIKYFGVEVTEEMISQHLGQRFEDGFAQIIKRFQLKVPLIELLQKHETLIEKYYQEVFPSMPNAAAILKTLKQAGYKIGLATGSPKRLAQLTLKRLELLDFFEADVYAEDVTNGKPNPEPFLLAAKKLKAEPEYTVVIEDSLNGFKAAKAAKMKLIGYQSKHNFKQDFCLTDKVATDLNDIFGLLGDL